MKFKNAIEINLDNIILLGNKEEFKIQGYDNKFLASCHWCYIKKEPDKVFCLNRRIIKDSNYRDNLDEEIFNSGVTVIDLKGMLFEELDRILRDNINKFVEKNINNISYFFEENLDDYQSISLYEMGKDIREQRGRGVNENIDILLSRFEYKDITNGIIELSTIDGKEHLIYDMKTMKFKNDDSDIFKKIYKLPTLKKILAYEQYKKGITPPFYNEVAKINEFLEGKKTVTLVFNDGNEKQVSAQISQILRTNHKSFLINIDINNKDISNLKAIRYGKKELEINTKNLIEIDKQLNEFIKTKEATCNINEEECELENE